MGTQKPNNQSANKLTPKDLFIAGTGFNVFWLVAVVGQYPWMPLLILLLAVSWWYYLGAWRFSMLMGGLGILMDSALAFAGILVFDDPIFLHGLPTWLMLLWIAFGCFVWVCRQYIMTSQVAFMLLLGSVGGVVSYFAGYRLGAVHWPFGIPTTLLGLLICWLVFSGIVIALLNLFAAYCRRSYEQSVHR